jgi:hypothetical protein
MRTFSVSKTTRSIVLESAIGVGATLAIALLCRVPYFGVGMIDPHPVWLVVLVIAARYGTRGLALSAAIAWGGLAAANGADGLAVVLETLATPVELGAAAATVLVGWIVSSNERRERVLAGKVEQLERRAATDAATIGELRRAALALRARTDRLDLSLTFLRNIARRMHGGDAEAAAQAALELIGARIGARAASVQMATGEALAPLAVVGIWNQDAPDRTALAALRAGQPMRALELPEGGPADSDIAAPISDAAGVVRGVVAARGVPGGGASMAALRDLSVIADWAAAAICDGQPPVAAEAAGASGEAAHEAHEAADEAQAPGSEPDAEAPADEAEAEQQGEREAALTVSRANA